MKLIIATTALLLVTSAAQADSNCEQAHDNPPWCDLVGTQIPGPQGDKGDKGDPGESIKGDPGTDGIDGIDGKTIVESQGPAPLGSLSLTVAAFSVPQDKSGIGFGISQGWDKNTIEGSVALVLRPWKDEKHRPAGFVLGYTMDDRGQNSFSAGIGWSF